MNIRETECGKKVVGGRCCPETELTSLKYLMRRFFVTLPMPEPQSVEI